MTIHAYRWGQLLHTPLHLSYPGQAGSLALWFQRLNHHPCWEPPSVWPSWLEPCPCLSPVAYITGYCANDRLLCLIITTLSLGCRGRSVAMCVCVYLWTHLSALLWESSHSPSLSENTISIHDSASTRSPRHTTTCMDMRIVMRNRKNASGVLAS